MRKFTRIIAFVFAVCLGAVSMTACGDSSSDKKSEKKESSKTVQATEENTTEETTEAESTTEPETTTVAEIKYEPTAEIMNADLRSGLIQIGNSVFRNGGYITVGDFVEKYKDEFDMSAIPTDEYLSTWQDKTAELPSLNDPELKIVVKYSHPEADTSNRMKVVDAIIQSVEQSGTENSAVILPKGLTDPTDMDYEEMKAFVEALDIRKDDSYGVIYNDAYKESINSFSIHIKANEENLIGKTPAYHYEFEFDSSTLKGIGVQYCDWVSSGNLSDFDEDDNDEYEEESEEE